MPSLVIPSALFLARGTCSLPVLHSCQKCSRIIKMTRLSFRPRVQLRRIHQNLPVRREFDLCAIHRTRRWSFEVDPLAVVTATVARALELVLTGLPVRRASQMCAACINHEQPVRRAVHPDAKFLLELGVDAQRKFGRIANLKDGVRFEKSAR